MFDNKHRRQPAALVIGVAALLAFSLIAINTGSDLALAMAAIPAAKRYLRFEDLKERGIVNCWPTLKRWVTKYGFPAGTYLTPSRRVWTEAEVEEWLARRADADKPQLRGMAEANAVIGLLRKAFPEAKRKDLIAALDSAVADGIITEQEAAHARVRLKSVAVARWLARGKRAEKKREPSPRSRRAQAEARA
jgi:predicted DNA-binding transcriptional regulator AlpA